MAKNETKQLEPKVLATDREVYKAIKALPDYAPANPAFTKDALDDSFEAMDAAQTEESKAKAAAMAARDNKVAAEWAFHNKTLGGKAQVEAQYGPDSNQLQSLLLKKKSEYDSPGKGGGKKGGGDKGEGAK